MHVVKSNSYKPKNYAFRVFRQSQQIHVLGTIKKCALELIFLSIHVQQTGILTVFEHIIMTKTPSEKTALQPFYYNIFINNTLITLYKLQLLLRGKRS